MKTHIMLDLETMGTRPDAAIIAIGAVAFDETGLGAEFYCPVNLQSSMQYGGTVDADTITWWMARSDEARKVCMEENVGIGQALANFAEFLLITVAEEDQTTQDSLEIWGNGADFDNVILASAYRNTGRWLPWGKYKNRCYRTIKSANRHIAIERTGTHHNALDDAKSQAQHLIRIWAAAKQGGAA